MSDTRTPGNEAERRPGYYRITCADSEPEVAHYLVGGRCGGADRPAARCATAT
jgi:hypothetical protein